MAKETKTQPFCWKCASKIVQPNEPTNGVNSCSLIGCKEEPKIHNYSDAKMLCPLLATNKVLITILGGVAHLVEKPFGIEVEIRDYDQQEIDAEGDPRCKQDEEGDWYQEIVWEADVKCP